MLIEISFSRNLLFLGSILKFVFFRKTSLKYGIVREVIILL